MFLNLDMFVTMMEAFIQEEMDLVEQLALVLKCYEKQHFRYKIQDKQLATKFSLVSYRGDWTGYWLTKS